MRWRRAAAPNLLGRDDIGHLAPGMSADFIAVKLRPARPVRHRSAIRSRRSSCAGPFKVDYSFINGGEIIASGEFVRHDVGAYLARHRAVMERIYQA